MTSTTTSTYLIGGMDCADCAREVEQGVSKLAGVRSATVEFATCKLRLEGDVPFATLQARVQALGKTIRPESADAPAPVVSRGGLRGFWDYLVARLETRLALVGGGLVLLTFVCSLLAPIPSAVTAVLYMAGMGITLFPIARSGLNTLRINREFNINLLMTIAAVGAIFLGEYLESATVIFLFAMGEALEGYTTDRARQSIRSLLALKPLQAVRLRGSVEDVVHVSDLRVGDLIVVRPGENIPMDGVVRRGSSSVNQAPITGESVPVHKGDGATVFAGTINGEAVLQVEVTQLAQDNTLSRIITLVEQAQSVRAPSQRLIDRFAHYYTPSVVVIAALIAVIPPLFFNFPFYDVGDVHGSLYRALSMLVIACPCALVISAPVTVISAITAAARRGVLIKGGTHLEALGTVKAIAFDKTGTLTEGKPMVTEYCALHHLAAHAAAAHADGVCAACNDVLALAAAVERRTSHPLARGVVEAAQHHDLSAVYPAAEAVEILAGKGVQGTVNGRLITVGNHALFDMDYPHHAEVCQHIEQLEARGHTAMMIADAGQVCGYITLADAPRASSQAAIAELNALGLTTIMLTGDNATVAHAVGAAVGVRDVRAGLLPADKVTAIRDLMTTHQGVAMIGDGVNDTPALATATVGIAMGGAGSSQALEVADVALMADDLSQLPFAIRVSRFARRLIRNNVLLSFGLKAAFLALALFGLTSLWVAIFADVGMSLAVTLNGMRPLAFERNR